MTAVDVGLENEGNLQEISDKLDTVLQQISKLEQEIQSHESLQDSQQQQLQSLELWGERIACIR